MKNALSVVLCATLETVHGTSSCRGIRDLTPGCFTVFGELGQIGSKDHFYEYECIKNIFSRLK